MRNKQVKTETRMAKIGTPVARRQLNRLGVAAQGMSEVLPKPPTSSTVSSDGGNYVCSSEHAAVGNHQFVPVVSSDGTPLMPCHPARARELLRKSKALRRFKKGVFYIKLTNRVNGHIQPVACGVDPGSKREGYTVKSEKHTFINIQATAVDWVSRSIKTRREMRQNRRSRKTPYRRNRMNRSHGSMPPSTRARWGWKLRICTWLSSLYPITAFVVEDVCARTKGNRRWDASFSPLQVGKKWFYDELSKSVKVYTMQGYETKKIRDDLELEKTNGKLEPRFSSHAVDSWALASSNVGGTVVDNKRLMCIAPIRLHRRQLHYLQPPKGGARRNYGGTRSLGLKRGSLIVHPKWGLTYIGGSFNDRISLCRLSDGRRLCQNIKPENIVALNYNNYKGEVVPTRTNKTGI